MDPLITQEDLKLVTDNFRINFSLIILLTIGFWFFFEFIEYHRKKTSLLKDILHHYYSPVISLLIGSFILAVLMEYQNIPVDLWVYINWPLEYITFLGLPLTVYLAWPLHYLMFLSLFRAFTSEESDEVWKSDTIP